MEFTAFGRRERCPMPGETNASETRSDLTGLGGATTQRQRKYQSERRFWGSFIVTEPAAAPLATIVAAS
jgi:hypothetical protein